MLNNFCKFSSTVHLSLLYRSTCCIHFFFQTSNTSFLSFSYPPFPLSAFVSEVAENNIISEVHSSVACFHKSALARIIVSIITLSLVITVFLLRHISCFPQIHIVSLVLRFLSFGCDTVGRCGQNSSLMPVKDKRYLLDETPGKNLHSLHWLGSGICLFPTLLSFMQLISFVPHAGCGLFSKVCAGGWMLSLDFCWQFIDLMFLSELFIPFVPWWN